MNDVVRGWLEKRWIYVSTVALVSILIYTTLEIAFFDGEWVSAMFQGAVGGVACGLVLFTMQQAQR
jgi:hypothetical protein